MTKQKKEIGSKGTAPPGPGGATWRRVDFHLHSPGVSSFTCPDGADLKSVQGRAVVVEKYVEGLKAQGISVCALTDYNGVRDEWFTAIRDAAARHGIIVFPGAELSFRTGKHGLHILVVFESGTKPEEINRFLQSLDRDPATPLFTPDRLHRDIDPKANIADSMKSLRERFGCLVILPHPAQENGICKTFQPNDAAQLLADLGVDAVEHCPDSEIKRLESTGVIDSARLQRLARVEFSDPKRIDEIGTKKQPNGKPRATFLKLSAVDLGALRLALRDPATRLAVGGTPLASHTRIRRMEVIGSGFLGNLTIEWNDDLNVIIGGRGAGKSAIIETLRYALRLESYSEPEPRDELVKHALGSGGQVTLTLERPVGAEKIDTYRIERVLGGDPRVYDTGANKIVEIEPVALLGDMGPPTILGQREVYAVSGSEEYRLRLLDDLIGEKARECAKSVREAVDAVRANAEAIHNKSKSLKKRDEQSQRLKTVEHELSVYEKHGAAGKLKRLTALKNDEELLGEALEALKEAQAASVAGRDEVGATLRTRVRELKKGQSDQKQLLSEAAMSLETLERELIESYAKSDALFSSAERELKDVVKRWEKALAPLETEINHIKREAHTDALDPDRVLALTKERAGLTPKLEQWSRTEKELENLRGKRQTLLQSVQDRRLEEHRLRRARAEAIGKAVGGRLRLRVEFKGQKEEYRERLAASLKGSGVTTDATQKLVAPEATDGPGLVTALRLGVEETVKRFGVTKGMAERLVRWAAEDEERLFDLETLIPGDALHVELQVEGEYRSLDKLSAGQRATAILLLLFALKGRVLVLDQPEDDLDNRFIYEDIVTILREHKGLQDPAQRRQIIAATHNANIPVIGDAELVLALEAREDRAAVIGAASIDDSQTRELIKGIMEGGEEAFRRRAEKYGGV